MRKNNVTDKETLQELYVNQSLSMKDIAIKFNVNPSVIKRQLIEFGLYQPPYNHLENEIIRLYSDGYSATRIASEINRSPNHILSILRKNGFDTSTHKRTKSQESKRYKITKEKLQNLYCDQHLSYNEISEIIGCDFTVIPYWLKKFEIPRRSIWETRRPKGWKEPDLEIVIHLYDARGMGTNFIGDMFGVSGQYIANMLRKNGIQIRKQGYPNIPRYVSKDGHYVRSGLELQVDDWLFDQELFHIYEPKIPNSNKRSDFLVGDTYIEIWGVENNHKYDENQKEKIQLYHSAKLKLISLYKEDFPDLEKLIQLLL